MVGYILPDIKPQISPTTIMDSSLVGQAPKAPAQLLWRRPKASSILVDGEIGGSNMVHYILLYLAPKTVPKLIILPEELSITLEGLLINFSVEGLLHNFE